MVLIVGARWWLIPHTRQNKRKAPRPICPTVLWTGNGYHIYLPVQLSGPSWCLGHTDTFMKLSKRPDLEFLRWSEFYLSDGLCDPAHCASTSFKNVWLRVPGSFNSKNSEPVRILQKWDGKRPDINWILRDFKYLVDKSLKPIPSSRFKQTKSEFSTKWKQQVTYLLPLVRYVIRLHT
jgi:hypothetical protein